MGNFSLSGANIVILAKNHNPSIVSKEWLVQKKIIEEPVVSFVHTPAFSVVEADNFRLVVDPDRLQISVKNFDPKNIENLPKITDDYVNQLPETPYTAIGFNYSYRVATEKRDLKDIFFVDAEKFRSLFSENYRLGGIVHFKFEDFAVRVNLFPTNEELTANFNFHFESRNLEEIKKKLKSYFNFLKKAEETLEGLFNV